MALGPEHWVRSTAEHWEFVPGVGMAYLGQDFRRAPEGYCFEPVMLQS